MFRRGDQIAYIPNHAEKDVRHPDVEFGFVTSIHPRGDAAYCRYWRKGKPGQLRTVANSELTPISNLVSCTSTSQDDVRFCLRAIENEEKENAERFGAR